MPTYSALSKVSDGIYAALNVAAVTSLATGGIGDDIAQDAGYPFVLYEVHETPQHHMGSQPGRAGQMPLIDLRVHVFSQYEGMTQAHAVMDAVIGALVTPPTISGYASWACFHDDTIDLGDQIIGGIKVKELVANFRLFVELR